MVVSSLLFFGVSIDAPKPFFSRIPYCTKPSSRLDTGEGQGGPLIDYGTRFLPAIASRGMVSGPEKLASEAGLDMLKKGGNAIDAAVATGFA